ncbi:ATP-binding cassette domain-containing protein [Sporosarcina siberiensis]|uniref:ATP-binding cassette domain-containing protein n=1 Tax=Sporosarcina siberiensis TaxID=1365606 RepID=A0ABW4SJE7_9BACL
MLNIDCLTVPIDGRCIIENSSFQVPEGKITSIIGESGSGKSMTVSAILGIMPPGAKVTGKVYFQGNDLIELPMNELMAIRKNSIFTVFQDATNSFNPTVKMEPQLYAFSGERKEDTLSHFRLKMERILQSLGLDVTILEQYPFELSGGMLQRCMNACALYVEPDLLIADEPTSSLDKVLQKEFIGLLKQLNEEKGTTVLLITHDLDIVVDAAHEVVVMYGGKVVETGSVTETITSPKHSYTKLLLASRF